MYNAILSFRVAINAPRDLLGLGLGLAHVLAIHWQLFSMTAYTKLDNHYSL